MVGGAVAHPAVTPKPCVRFLRQAQDKFAQEAAPQPSPTGTGRGEGTSNSPAPNRGHRPADWPAGVRDGITETLREASVASRFQWVSDSADAQIDAADVSVYKQP